MDPSSAADSGWAAWMPGCLTARVGEPGSESSEARMGRFITQYASQGDHRTGTDVDSASADWLAKLLTAAGGHVSFMRFPFKRRRLLAGGIFLEATYPKGVKSAEVDLDAEARGPLRFAGGVPLYDCGSYTDLDGVRGTLGLPGKGGDIALVEYSALNEAEDNPGLMEARGSPSLKAVLAVCVPPTEIGSSSAAPTEEGGEASPPEAGGEVTEDQLGARLGLINAQHFREGGTGVPTLQVHGRHLSALRAAASRGARATLVASMDEVEAEAVNVLAEVTGTEPALPHVMVLTPRSGWWRCAVERGASMAAFSEVLRRVAAARPRRTVLFVANTGHELGHVGNRRFEEERPGYIKGTYLCVHLGANWASAHVGPDDEALLLQASDEDALSAATEAFAGQGLGPERVHQVPLGERPIGEARELFDLGAKYVSVLGLGHKEFHLEEDAEAVAAVVLRAAMEKG